MDLGANAMVMTAKLALPFLLGSLAIGIVISLFQSVTSIQETTLTFVPKILVVTLIFAFAGHWMLSSMVGYTQQLYGSAVTLLGG